MITFLAIAIPAAVFAAGCAAIVRHRYRDEDPAPFNWQGTVPAGPGVCSCGAPQASAPFPGEPEPEPEPEPDPEPEPYAAPEYVTTALGGHDDAAGWIESRWRKIDGQLLAAQLRDGAL